MDANQLFFWMRGFFEQVTEPTPAQITAPMLTNFSQLTTEQKTIWSMDLWKQAATCRS
jgi:hypothetical protein